MRLYEIPLVLLLGFILDLLFGDPEFILHPVVLIGRLISITEAALRKIFPKNKLGERIAGFFLAIIVILISFVVPFVILYGVGRIPRAGFVIKMVLQVFWCWQILAMKTLAKEGRMVYGKVVRDDLPAARKQVSRIVGRDTENLSMTGVIKACIETIAESTSDGIIAPMIFIAIGGVPLGFMYKGVNTLDSMVGYRNEKYRYFGSASAWLDDIFNFIPARITAFLLMASAKLWGYDSKNARRIWKRDHIKTLSPNSGSPESAVAGALHIQLGGDANYFGEHYEKETLGDPEREVVAKDIPRTTKLMYGSSFLGLLVLELIWIVIIGFSMILP